MKIKLGTVNHVLRFAGFVLYVDAWNGEGERTPTTIELEFIGLPGTARRVAWEKRWFAEG